MRSGEMVCLACLALPTIAHAQPGKPLPPRDDWPRTEAEWRAQSKEPWRRIPAAERVPQVWKAVRSHMAAMEQKYIGPDVVFDEALADQLVAELWVDHGDPSLNGAVQHCVIDLTREVLRWPEDRLPPAARDRIAAGLTAFAQSGGGAWMSSFQADLAYTLGQTAPEDADVQLLADDLLADALEWALTVQPNVRPTDILRICERRWGEEAWWRVHEIEHAGTLPSESWPESYLKAVAALRAVLDTDGSVRQPAGLLERLRDAERAASVKQRDERLNDDLVCRLLIVYRTLLDRRPRIAFRTAAYIENQLLTLHTKGRLRTDRHWDLWSQAVKALESERLSKRFQRYLRARADKKDLPAPEAKALAALRPLLAE